MTIHRTLPSGQIIFDPRGAVSAKDRPLAPRPHALDGLRLGVLDNSKWNASKLLRETVDALAKDYETITVHRYVKDSFSRPASATLLEQIVAENDIAVTAIGD